MGYCAAANGTLTLKNADDMDKVLGILDADGTIDDFYETDSKNIEVYVHSDSRYHDDDLFELYKELAPYLDVAEIAFAGDDDAFWKHSFEEGIWKETPGMITYDDSKSWTIDKALDKEDDLEI